MLGFMVAMPAPFWGDCASSQLDHGLKLTEELLQHCREHLSRQKVPRSIDYEAELPRLPTGKLYKRLLRDRYWGEGTNKIV